MEEPEKLSWSAKRKTPYQIAKERQRLRIQMARKRANRRGPSSMLDTSMNTSCQCQPNAYLRRTSTPIPNRIPPPFNINDLSDIERCRSMENTSDDGETSHISTSNATFILAARGSRKTTDDSTVSHRIFDYERNSLDRTSTGSTQTSDSDNTKRIQSSFPESWILKSDPNSKLKNDALRQLQLCKPQKKERLTPDSFRLHTNSGDTMDFYYRNFRDLKGDPYPVEFEPTTAIPKMRCYNIVAIGVGAPTFPTHTWLLLQDIKCPGIRYLTKINVESWRRYLTVEDEQNDESLG